MLYPQTPYQYPNCCVAVPGRTLLEAQKDGNFHSYEWRPRFGNGFLTYDPVISQGHQDGSYAVKLIDLNGNRFASLTLDISDSGATAAFACVANPAIVDADGRLIVREAIDLANDTNPGSGTTVCWLELDGGGDITFAVFEWLSH
jgi:hypothetical protein